MIEDHPPASGSCESGLRDQARQVSFAIAPGTLGPGTGCPISDHTPEGVDAAGAGLQLTLRMRALTSGRCHPRRRIA